MTQLEIEQFTCFDDNYGYLLHDANTGLTAAIDTPEPTKIMDALARRGWQLSHILNTHHHFDHAGGNLFLKEKTGCHIIGPAGEADKIPGLDEAVDEGDTVRFGKHFIQVMNVGGHTSGHIAYHIPEDDVAFVGDCIFTLGCGRIFEGTAAQMWESLQKIAALPPATKIYCAHEYTQNNAAFAITIEPENSALQARLKEIDALRANALPTVPTTVAQELATNPFLRAGEIAIREKLNMMDASTVEVFAEIRRRKDAA